MRDAGNDWTIEAEGLLGPAEGDIVVDPASLEHLASDASLAPSTASGAGEALVLSLEDLLPDVDGAVVMLADDSLPVNLVTDQGKRILLKRCFWLKEARAMAAEVAAVMSLGVNDRFPDERKDDEEIEL